MYSSFSNHSIYYEVNDHDFKYYSKSIYNTYELKSKLVIPLFMESN